MEIWQKDFQCNFKVIAIFSLIVFHYEPRSPYFWALFIGGCSLKKYFRIFYISVFLFSTVYVLPFNQSRAAANTLSASMTAPVSDNMINSIGAYIAYGTMVTAGAAAVASGYTSQLQTKASQLWTSASATAKTDLTASINAARAAGKTSLTLTSNTVSALQSAFNGFGSWLHGLLTTTEVDSKLSNHFNSTMGYTGNSNVQSILDGTSSTLSLIYSIDGISNAKINILFGSTAWQVQNGSTGVYGPTHSYVGGVKPTATDLSSFTAMEIYLQSQGAYVDFSLASGSQVPSNTVLDGAVTSTLNDMGNGINDVNVGLDNWTPTAADGSGTLNYNPQSNTWNRTTDGSAYTGGVTWNPPAIGARAGSVATTANPTLTDGNVVVDGTALVIPTSSATTVGTSTTGTGTVSIDTSGDAANTAGLDLTPLQTALGSLTSVFPFSVPWDFSRLFSVLNVTPETPKFTISADKTVSIMGVSIPVNYDFTLDFSMFDSVAAIGRWALILVFDIAIILALRRLTPD